MPPDQAQPETGYPGCPRSPRCFPHLPRRPLPIAPALLLHPDQGRLGGKTHLAERGNIWKTEGNYTHIGNIQGKHAGRAGRRCATPQAASPDRAFWEPGATATKVSWVRLRISWRLAGAGLPSEPRCKETEVCGGRPEAPPQSSGSRFSDDLPSVSFTD